MLIEHHLSEFRKSQRTTIFELCIGLLMRGQAGLAAIARGMDSPTTVRHRIKRAWRFLKNPGVRCEKASQALIRWICVGGGRAVVALDWTDLKGDRVMLAANIAFRKRAVPIAWLVMEKGQFTARRKSRNDAEERLIQQVQEAMGDHRWVLLADRGFCRADLLAKLNRWKISYVIRAVGTTWFHNEQFSGILDNLPRKPGAVARYRGFYQKKRRVPLSLVVTHEEPAAEPWYLASNLDKPSQSVGLYRKRAWIEQSFRDAKTHLGLKKLWLWYAERMERMMILIALVILVSILAAAHYRREHPGQDPQLTTRRKGTTMSVFQMGLELIRLYGFPSGLSSIRLLALRSNA